MVGVLLTIAGMLVAAVAGGLFVQFLVRWLPLQTNLRSYWLLILSGVFAVLAFVFVFQQSALKELGSKVGLARSPVAFRPIKIDGLRDDWQGVAPFAVSDRGLLSAPSSIGSGLDIKGLFLAADKEYLYCMVELYDPPATRAFTHGEGSYNIRLTRSMAKETPVELAAHAWLSTLEGKWVLCIYDAEGKSVLHGDERLTGALEVVEFAIPWADVKHLLGEPLPDRLYISGHVCLHSRQKECVDRTEWKPLNTKELAAVISTLSIAQIRTRAPAPTPLAVAQTPTPVPLTPSAPQAPSFTLSEVSGKIASLSDFKGKVVLLNFWATWCPPCRQEIPELQAFYDEYRDRGVVLIGVNLREDKHLVQRFMQEQKMTFPILLDTEGKVDTLYEIQGIPTTFLLDRELTIRGKVVGSTTKARLAELVAPFLR